MFVFTAKMSKRMLALGVVLAGVVLFGLVYMLTSPGGAEPVSKIITNDERVDFLESYGWQVDPAPVEFSEVTVPDEFDEVYRKYNELQKLQGYDLSRYRGRRVMQYTYRLNGYPGEAEGSVLAHLLIYRQKVIGGDICSLRMDGFMHGFSDPAGTNLYNASAEPKAGETDSTDEEKTGEKDNAADADSGQPAEEAAPAAGDTMESIIPWLQK